MNRIVLLTILLIAPATAQLEPLTDALAPSISLSMDAEGTFTTDQPSSFLLTVTNDGAATGTPLDQPLEIKLELQDAPTSWVVEISPAIIDVMPGASETSTVTVSVPPGGQDSGVVTIHGFANQGILVLQAEGDDTASIELTNADTVTRDLLETLGSWIWLLLALLILTIIMVIVMWLQSGKKPLQLSVQSATVSGAPGARVTVPVQVKNLTKEHVTVLFEVSDSPSNWAAFMMSPEMTLDGHASGEAQFVCIIPEQNPGAKAVYELKANSSAGPKQAAKLKLTVLVE